MMRAKAGVRRKLPWAVVTLIGVMGLLVPLPAPVVGQANPPQSAQHSAELEEALRLNQQVLQLLIPTKAFAAALAALGVVLAKPNITYHQVDINQHFEQLCSLPKGTQVFYQYGKNLLLASTRGRKFAYHY